jgi:hypothetical protein
MPELGIPRLYYVNWRRATGSVCDNRTLPDICPGAGALQGNELSVGQVHAESHLQLVPRARHWALSSWRSSIRSVAIALSGRTLPDCLR